VCDLAASVISGSSSPLLHSEFHIAAKTVPTFYFIGVSTGKSSIMPLFPVWMKELGRPEVAIEGVDLKLHDERSAYRQVVAQIKYDPMSLGALVTSHKIDLLAAARDLFDYLDPYAVLCDEVSSISKGEATGQASGGQLEGHAKDPISAGLSLDAQLGPGYFARTGGEVLCFGAGGSATAIVLHLVNKPDAADRPKRCIIVNRSPGRLESLRNMVERLQADIALDVICNEDPERNDRITEGLPPGSLVINATGMGKDRPGSPITDAAIFPLGGSVWELNYRGELGFMRQAMAQREMRRLRVDDGWLYFLHGWTQVLAQVLHMPIGQARFQELALLAESIR
jgi:shikimate dehydrogenase